MIFFEPIFAVAQQEMEHVVFAVIEAQTVPSRVFVAVAFIEKLIRVARQIAQAFDFIFNGVAVNNIHNDADTHLVSRVNHVFKLVGCAATA